MSTTNPRPIIFLDKVGQIRKDYIQREWGSLVGKTVHSVRPLTKNECEGFGWDYEREDAFVIVFTDGTALVPSQDPEGNGAGFLFMERVGK